MSKRIVISTLTSPKSVTALASAVAKELGAEVHPALGGPGGSREQWQSNPEAVMLDLLTRVRSCESAVVAGAGLRDDAGADELCFDAQVAANLAAPFFIVIRAEDVTDLATTVKLLRTRVERMKATLAGVIVVGEVDTAAETPVPVYVAAEDAALADLAPRLVAAAEQLKIDTVTPLGFQMNLIDKARANKRTIVLPESEDDRILQAAHEVLEKGVADLVLLGEEAQVHQRAEELGLNLSGAKIVSLNDPQLREKYAVEFARLREKKGVTLEQARETLGDVSYFGTMMVYMGDADGMVSGAAHTTAHTIRPSFQTIKTKPGSSVVSSVFLMLMDDHVLVFGDCAVNPNPTPEQLAEIAATSAQTAKQFGVEPRVALISYSTGSSGAGPDVEAVTKAVELAKQAHPDLALDGPLQFDAAYDPKTGQSKLPGSPVAGQATVYVFPDLNTGNCTYKAVQRTAGAVAVGPVLQGLNKPVNDLSRGALVEDIVNTVVITAVQAGS